MDNKLTDNEIIKDLTDFHHRILLSNLAEKITEKEVMSIVEAIDLINRMKAQNKESSEKLVIYMGTIDWQAKEINRQKEEIERLQKHSKEVAENCTQLLRLNDKENNKRFLEAIEVVKFEVIKEFAEKAKPILREMFDLMMDDDEGKCIVENCKKHSSIPCMNEYCIKENREAWETKVDDLVKEMVGENDV